MSFCWVSDDRKIQILGGKLSQMLDTLRIRQMLSLWAVREPSSG